MSSINGLFQFITIQKSENEYLRFSNADNKLWIIPKKSSGLALNLYQPSSIKGKLFKQFLPYFKNNKIFQKKLKISVVKYCLEDSLDKLLKAIFKADEIEFAIFGGTPSKHQKITIQIFKANKILGYCKVTNNKEVKDLFIHEEKVLTQLNKRGIGQIPVCLFNGHLNDELAVFMQSTIKTNNSKVVPNWKTEHWNFLLALKRKTEQHLLFKETDYFKTLQLLENNTSYLLDADAQIIKKAILKVSQFYQNNNVCFSAYHADFTPWNMFEEKKRLFVFDFEYAKMTYPPYLDWFHFFTQTSIFEKHLDANNIYDDYCLQKRHIEKYITNPDFNYLCYLLANVCLFLNRDKGVYTKDVESNLTIWIKLIARL